MKKTYLVVLLAIFGSGSLHAVPSAGLGSVQKIENPADNNYSSDAKGTDSTDLKDLIVPAASRSSGGGSSGGGSSRSSSPAPAPRSYGGSTSGSLGNSWSAPARPAPAPSAPPAQTAAPRPSNPAPAASNNSSAGSSAPRSSAAPLAPPVQRSTLPRQNDLRQMNRSGNIGNITSSSPPKVNKDNSVTQVHTTDTGAKVKTVTRPDGSLAYAHTTDASGKITGKTFYNKDGKPAVRESVHKDGNGSTKSYLNPQTGKPAMTVSSRKTADGRTATTTTVHRDDGSREVTRPSGNKEVYQKVNGRDTLVSKTEKTPDGGTRTMNRQDLGNGSYKQTYTTVNASGGTTVNNYYYSSHPVYGGGISLHFYTPIYHPYYYNPFFYTPFVSPISYGWYAPLYPGLGYYGYWYHPYPYYAYPHLYVFDFLMLAMMNNRYQTQVAIDNQTAIQQQRQIRALQDQVADLEQDEADRDAEDATPVAQSAPQPNGANKKAMDDEIKRQVELQVKAEMQKISANAKAAPAVQPNGEPTPGAQVSSLEDVFNPTNASFDPKHVFAIHQEIADNAVGTIDGHGDFTVDAAGAKCKLVEGDLIQIAAAPKAGDEAAYVRVVSSADEDDDSCGGLGADKRVAVSISHMNDMIQEFTKNVQNGMDKMKDDPKFKDGFK